MMHNTWRPCHRHTSLLGLLIIVAITMLVPSGAFAGGGAHCQYPFVFRNADVNVLIVPYTYEAPDNAYRYQTNVFDVWNEGIGAKLAQISQLDTLYGLRYPFGIGAVHLFGEPGDCKTEAVLKRLLHGQENLAPAHGKGVVVLWGKFFELDDGLYVQSFVRFFRRGLSESLEIDLPEDESYLLALLGRQTIAFPPRRLDKKDFSGIKTAFDKATVVLDDQGNRVGDLRVDRNSGFAYGVERVDDATGQMFIRPHKRSPGSRGWVAARSDPKVWPLRQRLPELTFVNALAGYLGFRIIESIRPESNWAGTWPKRLAKAQVRTLSALEDYRKAVLTPKNRDALAAGGAPKEKIALGERHPLALSYALQGTMALMANQGDWLSHSKRVAAADNAGKAFQAAQNIAPSIPAHQNIGGVAAVSRCCGSEGPIVTDAALEALRSFRATLSLEPSNLDALHNLATLYRLFEARNAGQVVALSAAELSRRRSTMERILNTARKQRSETSVMNIYFRSGDTDLSEAMRSVVAHAVFTARRLGAERIVLHGYSDPAGSADRNLVVSRERVQSVAQALANAGVDADRIRLLAHGEDDPRRAAGEVTTDTQGRRVEIHYE